MVLTQEGMLKRNVDAAVTVFDVKNHRVAAHFAPPPDNTQTVIAARHQTGQIDRSHLKIARHGDRLFHNRCIQDSWDDDRLTGL